MSKVATFTVTGATVETLCDDKLEAAKISFFASVAVQCKLILKYFQRQAPHHHVFLMK